MRTAKIQMKAHEDKRANIDIYGTIGRDFWGEGIDPKEFKDALDALGDIDLLEVRIHSYGGFVSEGMAIYNALNRHSAVKHVFVDGMAASMASVILMVGDKKYIAANASIMIHDPFNICIGNADDMYHCARDLTKSKEQLLDIYEKSVSIDRDEISEKMSETTRMNAKEALEWGFVDVIGDEVEEDHKNHENYFDFKIAAHADIGKIAPFLAFNSNSGNPETDEDLSMSKQTSSGDAGATTHYRKAGRINAGAALAALLNDAIDGIDSSDGDDRSRSDVISQMASAASISEGTVNQILNADIDCPPLSRLRGFASVSGIPSLSAQRERAERDGCEYGEAADLEANVAAAATSAETERVSGILALSQPGVESLVNRLALDGKTSVAEAGLQVAQKLKETSADTTALATRKEASNAVVTEDPNAAPGTQAAISEGDDDAAWEANLNNCQQEFRGHKGSFVAYNEAARNGQIKILERSVAA